LPTTENISTDLSQSSVQWIAQVLKRTWDVDAVLPGIPLDPQIQFTILSSLTNHHLLGLVYKIAQENPGWLPRSIQRQIAVMFLPLAAQLNKNKVEALKIINTLSPLFHLVVLKGWALLPVLYNNDPSLRPCDDIDLFIPEAEIPLALELLARIGYKDHIPDFHVGFRFRYGSEISLSKKTGALSVDLHWHPFRWPAYWINFSEYIMGGTTFVKDDLGNSYPVLDQNHSILYLCAHAGLHHGFQVPLINLYEIALLVKDVKDWSRLLSTAFQLNLSLCLLTTFQKINDLWPGIIKDNIIDQISSLPITTIERKCLISTGPDNSLKSIFTLSSMLPGGFLAQTKYLFEYIFPTAAFIRTYYDLPPNISTLQGYRIWFSRGFRHFINRNN
jgi:hypothetical protein